MSALKISLRSSGNANILSNDNCFSTSELNSSVYFFSASENDFTDCSNGLLMDENTAEYRSPSNVL